MSSHTSTTVQHAVAGVRQSMSDLDAAIGALRAEATRLRESADNALAVALLDHPTGERGPTLEALLGARPGIVDAPVEVDPDPRPLPTDDHDDSPAVFAPALVPATRLLAAAESAQPQPHSQPARSYAWNPEDAHEDDEAFEKFFAADVEPEPAQRWLLDER